jgi:hypothetical protein
VAIHRRDAVVDELDPVGRWVIPASLAAEADPTWSSCSATIKQLLSRKSVHQDRTADEQRRAAGLGMRGSQPTRCARLRRFPFPG